MFTCAPAGVHPLGVHRPLDLCHTSEGDAMRQLFHDELEQIALTALDSGFAPAAQREALREEVLRPAYAAAR